MTKDRDFKRRVRERMAKTGESYTAARARLLAGADAPPPGSDPAADLPEEYAELAGMSDEAVAAKTGRRWPEWTAWLDERGAADLPHPEIVRLLEGVIESHWWRQSVTGGYERIRGLREPGQRRSGLWDANRSRTLPVPADALYRWAADGARRAEWITEPHEVRGTNPPKTVRLDWPDGTRVQLHVSPAGPSKARIAVQHSALPDRETREARKRFWGERLDALRRRIG